MKTTSVRNCKRLLLIDDDPSLILLVEHYLKLYGYEVISAENGLDGLEVLDREIPDMIICDVMMPGMDGYSFVKHVRKDTRTEWIPILLLSALSQSQERIKGLKSGADFYMTKPFEPEELVAQVESSLKQTFRLMQQPKRTDNAPKIQVRLKVPLSPRELKVAQYVAQGMTNREIADAMNAKQRTIESYVSSMLRKTGLRNRTELAQWHSSIKT